MLLEELGRGGQGVVYRALHRDTNEIFALKTVLPQDVGSSESLTRFQREAAAAQGLDHPYTMPVREVGCSADGIPFFSMDLALGGNLHQLGAKYRGRWRQIAELMVKISEAVQHAHGQGILHRDLKPGNILFTEDHKPLVTDFGLAKQLTGSADLTQSCTILGTPNYVSPEQAAGRTKELSATSDVYSLGAILFELLTGRPPFMGDNPLEVLRQVASQSPCRPRRLVPAVPKALELICMRCLERRPEDRYASAQRLSTDLENWLHGRRVTARSWYATTWRALHRTRWSWTWWHSILGVGAMLFMLWVAFEGSGRSSITAVRVAVAIDDFDQDSLAKQLASQGTDELKRAAAQTAIFTLVDAGFSPPQSPDEAFDPIAYGRTRNAQVVLAGCLRRSGTQIRLSTRLVRCDTQDVLWRRIDRIPVDHVLSTLPTVAGEILADIELKRHANPQFFASSSVGRSTISDAQAYFAKAKELATRTNQGDLQTAVTFFRQAADMDPKFAAARAMLGFALWAQADRYGELDKLPLALSAAHEALAIDQGCAQAHRVIASCFFKTGRYEKALEEFWNAFELDPQSPGNYQSLGVCLREMGHPGQAIPWLTRGVRLDRAHGVFQAALGESLAICGRDREAEEALTRAVTLDSNQPDVWIVMCALRTWQKQYGVARQICAQTRLRFPESRFGLSLAAWIALCDGKDLEAKHDFEELRFANSYPRTYEFYGAINPASALAYLAKKEGDLDRAHALAQEALALDKDLLVKYPHNARILHDVAATRCLLGDAERSMVLFDEAFGAGWAEHRSSQIDPRFLSIVDRAPFKRVLGRTLPDLN